MRPKMSSFENVIEKVMLIYVLMLTFWASILMKSKAPSLIVLIDSSKLSLHCGGFNFVQII